jgi:FO synthase subunit 1
MQEELLLPFPVSEVLVLSGEVSPSNPQRRAALLNRVKGIGQAALDAGFLPHTNAGPLTEAEMASLAEANVSMGLMVEQTSPRLASARAGPHARAPSKRDPSARIAQLELAGRLGIPFTTGVLCGIGETRDERRASLEAIAEVAARYGHIGEVIIQPYRPASRGRWRRPQEPDGAALPGVSPDELADAVALARAALPSDVVIQVPPNLVWTAGPEALLACVEAGARDLGGIGPIDEVNTEHVFPLLGAVQEALGRRYSVRPRLPLYPRHYSLVRGERARALVDEWAGRHGERPPRQAMEEGEGARRRAVAASSSAAAV